MGKKTLISTLARPCLIFEMEIWIHFLQKKTKKSNDVIGVWFLILKTSSMWIFE